MSVITLYGLTYMISMTSVSHHPLLQPGLVPDNLTDRPVQVRFLPCQPSPLSDVHANGHYEKERLFFLGRFVLSMFAISCFSAPVP